MRLLTSRYPGALTRRAARRQRTADPEPRVCSSASWSGCPPTGGGCSSRRRANGCGRRSSRSPSSTPCSPSPSTTTRRTPRTPRSGSRSGSAPSPACRRRPTTSGSRSSTSIPTCGPSSSATAPSSCTTRSWSQDDRVATIDDPELGTVLQPGPLVRMDATPAQLDRSGAAPRRARRRDPRGVDAPRFPHRAPTRAELERTAAKGVPPLAGVTVLELGTYYAAPYGATLLADLGARVIKIEQLDGDPIRHILPFPEVGAIKVLAGQGEHRRRHRHRRRPRDRPRARAPRRRGVAVVPRRRRRTSRVHRRRPARGQPRPRVPQRAGLRRRPAVRAPPRLRAHDRRRVGPRVPQRRRRRQRPAAHRLRPRVDQALLAVHELGGHGLAQRRSAVGRERRHRARARAPRQAARRARPGDAHVDALDGGARALRGHGRVRRTRPTSPRPTPSSTGCRRGTASTARRRAGCSSPRRPTSDWSALAGALVLPDDLRDDDDALAEALAERFASRPADEWERELTALDVACVAVSTDATRRDPVQRPRQGARGRRRNDARDDRRLPAGLAHGRVLAIGWRGRSGTAVRRSTPTRCSPSSATPPTASTRSGRPVS